MSPARVYGGMTATERDRQRRTRLIDAAIELMGTVGAAETTVTAVCGTSRVTSRYFYQHFVDRNALLTAVVEQLTATLQDLVEQTIPAEPTTPADVARGPIGALVHLIESDPGLARILFVESGTEPVLRQLRSDVMASFADLVLQKARIYLGISDSTTAVAHLTAALAVGGAFDVLGQWHDGKIGFTADEIGEHIAGCFASLAGYIVYRDSASAG